MKRTNLLADPNAPYKAYCNSLTPGKIVKQDMMKSMDISALMSGKVAAPTVVSFSGDFFRQVYNYYAKQLSQPALDPNSKMETNQDLVDGVAKLFAAVKQNEPVKNKIISSMSDLLGKNLIIGEITHNSVAPKKFLIENMQELKKSGVDTLYLEHIYYDETQSSLDNFNKSGVLDNKLAARLHEFDRGYKHFPAYDHKDMKMRKEHRERFSTEWDQHNYTAVVNAAHAAGLRVVAIDIKDIYETQSQNKIGKNNSVDRIICGDYSFANIIQYDQNSRAEKGTWVALIGAAHVEGLERLLQQDVTTVLAGDRKNSVIQLNCRDSEIKISDDPNSINLPKSDVVIAIPVGNAVPAVKDELRSSLQARL
jgi:hypothetical protein